MAKRGSQRPSSSALQFENYARRLRQLSGFDDPVLEAALEQGIREQATAQVERAEQSAGLTGGAQTVLGGFARAQSATLASEAAMSKRMQNQRMLLEMEQKALSTSAQLKEERYKTNLQHERFLEQMAYQRSQKKSALMGALGGAIASMGGSALLKGLFKTTVPSDPDRFDIIDDPDSSFYSVDPTSEMKRTGDLLGHPRFYDDFDFDEGVSISPMKRAGDLLGHQTLYDEGFSMGATPPPFGSIQAQHAPPSVPDLIPWARLDTGPEPYQIDSRDFVQREGGGYYDPPYGITELPGTSRGALSPPPNLPFKPPHYPPSIFPEQQNERFDYWGSGDPSPWDYQVPAEWRMNQPLHAPPVTGGTPYWFEDRGEESMQLRNNYLQTLLTRRRIGW